MGFDVLTTNTSPLDPVRMLITHTLLVFYTPRHPPNYPADDSIWKAQNKCIPARKVKKDKLQMNQNSNSQGNLVVHSFAIFFQKKSDVCPVRIQPSLKKTFKLCGVITMAYFSQCYSTSIPLPPPPPHGRFLCVGLLPEHLQCFFIRMPKDPSPTLHRFLNFLGMVDQFHRHRWKYPLKISQVTKFESDLSVEN